MSTTQIQLSGGRDRHGAVAPLAWPDKPRKKLDNRELLALMDYHARVDDNGRDHVRQMLEKTWFVNIVAYAGMQNLDFRNLLLDYDINFAQAPEDIGYQANHIMALVLRNVARKNTARPSWDVTPMTPDTKDQFAAKVAQQILEHAYEHLNMRDIRREMSFWLETTGNAFLWAGWDDQAGRSVDIYENPMAPGSPIPAHMLNEQEQQFLESVGSKKTLHEGDWTAEVLSGFSVRVPHRYTRLQDMPWLVVDRLVSMHWIWDHYPRHAPDIRPDEMVSSSDTDYLRRLASLVNGQGFFMTSGGYDSDEVVRLQYMWIPPSRLYPNGIYAVRTRDRVLENKPHPKISDKVEGRFPIFHCRNMKLPGRFWGMSTVEHLIEPQRDYNRARTQEILVRDKLAHPIWMAPKQAEWTHRRMDIGDVIEYNARHKPELQPPPSMSQWHQESMNAALSDMQTIAAQSDASQGQVPEGVRSGIAIAQLQEQDEMVMSNSVEELEDGLTSFGNYLLKLFQRHARMPRAVRIYGESQASEIQFFSGATLDGNYSMRVTPGSMRPRSKAATMQNVDVLVQRGVLQPMNPAHARMILEAFDVGGVDKLFQHEMLDRRRARIENELFNKPGENPEFAFPDVDEDFDDHQVHLDEHIAFAKTDTYERWPPIRKVAFKAHIAKHQQAIARMMEAAVTFQSASGPSGAGASGQANPRGKPSPPADKQPTPGTEGPKPQQ